MQHDAEEMYGFQGNSVLRAAKPEKGQQPQFKLYLEATDPAEAEYVAHCLTACRGLAEPVKDVNALLAFGFASLFRSENTITAARLYLLERLGDNPAIPESVHKLLRDMRQ